MTSVQAVRSVVSSRQYQPVCQASVLPAAEDLHLCVDDQPHGRAVLLHLTKLLLDLLPAQVVGPLGAGLGEGLLLGLGPVHRGG